jgi:uncharacterized protein YneF (UPF0154 family)
VNDLILALVVLAAAFIGAVVGGLYVAATVMRAIDDHLYDIANDLDPEDPPT